MSFIELQQVSKYYGDFLAVDKVDISIAQGQMVALLGSNGAGKSTLIKMLCGLLKPSAGQIAIDKITHDQDAQRIRKLLGYVPEESAMYNDVTVMDYLRFFAALYGIAPRIAQRRIEENLRRLDLDAGAKRIGELSKGMKRKVLIARSLLNNPQLLIYDEPASGLDPQTAASILAFMQEQVRLGTTILFSSHNLSHVEQIAHRVIIIHKGKKVHDTSLAELQRPNKHYVVTMQEKDGLSQQQVTLEQLQVMLNKAKDRIVDVHPLQQSVEEVFLALVK